jgi:hypothetical protein
VLWPCPQRARNGSHSEARKCSPNPGIKREQASAEKTKHKKRSQFRVASRNIAALYEMVETVDVRHA